jgi:hypothetical protein
MAHNLTARGSRSAREDAHERTIGSLCERSGASIADVRALFAQEFARLALGATVRSYLAVLTAANVYARLRLAKKRVATEAPRQSKGLATLRGPLPEARQAIETVGTRPDEQDVEAPILLPIRKPR